MNFDTSTEAFETLYHKLNNLKPDPNTGMKSLKNVMFTIQIPQFNIITTHWRNFNKDYAESEWKWYLSKSPFAFEIAEKASIWKRCMDRFGRVNSNYGNHIFNHGQWDYVKNLLQNDTFTRRASLSIYDAKKRDNFNNDTPCTYAINFYIEEVLSEHILHMTVMMRSNDLWFGFCNDQYQFSKIQEKMAQELGISIGTYTHFVNDLHLYPKHFHKNK